MFNFKRLIKKYSKYPVYLFREGEGYHDPYQGGKWVPGKAEEIEIEGAVVPLSNNDLRFDEGGTYTVEDRKLYCYTKIDKGEQVKHKDTLYTVLEGKAYDDFDTDDEGLFIYVLRRGGND